MIARHEYEYQKTGGDPRRTGVWFCKTCRRIAFAGRGTLPEPCAPYGSKKRRRKKR